MPRFRRVKREAEVETVIPEIPLEVPVEVAKAKPSFADLRREYEKLALCVSKLHRSDPTFPILMERRAPGIYRVEQRQVIFCGFYTLGTKYEAEAAECIATLDAFGLEHDFIGVNNLGTWARNCAQKPAAILQLMDKHAGPLVYLDVDSRVRQRPELFDRITTDIAVHYRGGNELLSSVIYLRPTAIKAIELWNRECRQFIASGSCDHCLFEQLALQRVLEGDAASVFRLPPEYARVYDDPKMGVAVIEQQQASRRLAITV